MAEKYAFEIAGGIQMNEVSGDLIETRAVFPEDPEWPAAVALLVLTKQKEKNSD